MQAESQALGNMGITRMNLTHFEEAIVNFEQQLASLERGGAKPGSREKARAYGNLGDCYDSLGDLREGVKYHEQCLQLSLQVIVQLKTGLLCVPPDPIVGKIQ